MALDFDKEMDFLLRNTARKGDFLSGKNMTDNHLDADEIAAFAENALPQSARSAYVAHFAECDSCRSILSNFILMNEDAEESPASVIVSEKIVVSEKQTWSEWFAGLFSLPKLGYATATLAILFIGTFAYINFQANKTSQTAMVQPAEVGQAEQRPQRQNPAPAPTQVEEQEVAAAEEPTPEDVNANTAVALDASPTPNASSEDNLPPSYRVTTGRGNNKDVAPVETQTARNNQSSNSVAASTPSNPVVAQATPAAESRDESKIVTDDAELAKKADDAKAKEELDRNKQSVAVTSAAPAGVADVETAQRSAKPAAAPPTDLQKRERVLPPRTVGGKTFRNRGNLWVDSAYGSQILTNVSRGSDEYKKLDAAVRSIADNFRGETVIIVSQGKAYRIR